jgi:hypothetical protein
MMGRLLAAANNVKIQFDVGDDSRLNCEGLSYSTPKPTAATIMLTDSPRASRLASTRPERK